MRVGCERVVWSWSDDTRESGCAGLDRLRREFSNQILQVFLFGSKARGDSDPWSDIDILIVFPQEGWPLRRQVSTIAADVSLEHNVLIGPRVIGRERWERMRRHGFSLYRNVVAEGVPLTAAPTSLPSAP